MSSIRTSNKPHISTVSFIYQRPTVFLNPSWPRFSPRSGRARLKIGETSDDIILLLLSPAGNWRRATGSGLNGGIGMTGTEWRERVSDLSNPCRCAWVSDGSGDVVEVSGLIRPKPALGRCGLELMGW